jgi:hypothetical protein
MANNVINLEEYKQRKEREDQIASVSSSYHNPYLDGTKEWDYLRSILQEMADLPYVSIKTDKDK